MPSPLIRNDWRIGFRDVVVQVHRLLRAMVAGQDYAGAARALAVLHRLHGGFDPDVYRYTVALLRMSGDHTVRICFVCQEVLTEIFIYFIEWVRKFGLFHSKQ